MADTRPALNLLDLMDAFDTDIECRTYLEQLRWPKGDITCPRGCEKPTISRIKARKVFECDSCGYQFSVTAGTLFHDSHLPLPKWFLAIFLMCESKKGMSANQLKRMLKVSYKTAWYLCHRIRAAMVELHQAQLSGTVEVDETYIGGRKYGVGSGNKVDKAMVIAAIQRGGQVRIRKSRSTRATKPVLHAFVNEHITGEAPFIYTDQARGYIGIGDADTEHASVNHGAKEYVRGDVHTNTVESVFSLFKRSLVGSFHQVSVKHLDRYLSEFEFRFNNRTNPYLFRDVLLKLMSEGAMPYETLTQSA